MKKVILYLFCLSSNLFSSANLEMLTYLQIDFDISMSHLERYRLDYAKKDPDWIQAKHLYNTHILNNFEYCEKPRIPKIIHQIWLGSDFPQEYKEYQQSWIKNHPDWEYKLWTERDIEQFGLVNQHMYNTAKNYGEKSDIARLEILDRFGGLYIDTDFECLKPFDIFHHCCDFYTGCVSDPHVVCFNGLIAAAPGHPILKRGMIDLENNARLHKDSIEKTGPGFFTRCILKEFFNESVGRCVLFPAPYFYPWPWYKRDRESCATRRKFIKPESFAIHHWEVSWLRRRSK